MKCNLDFFLVYGIETNIPEQGSRNFQFPFNKSEKYPGYITKTGLFHFKN